MAGKAKTGRPPRRGGRATHLIRFRLTAEEYRRAQEKAAARGLTVSEWARRKLGLARS